MSLLRVGIVQTPRSSAGLPEILRVSAGVCQPVILITHDVDVAHPRLALVARQLFETVVVPRGEIAKQARQLRLSGLTTFSDSALDDVDAAIEQLGMFGLADTASPWDKLVQRQLLRGAGLTKVQACAVNSRQDLRPAIEQVGLPGVLKPRRSAGGGGVALLRHAGDVEYQLSTRQDWNGLLYETMLADGRHPSGVEGLADFVSVEMFSTAQQHRLAAVFDKRPVTVLPRRGAGGADLVSVCGDLTPSRLPEADRGETVEFVSRCLDALGVRWRVTHTEVKLTPAGPEIIEVNGRVGGFLNRLLRLVAGADLVHAALRLSLGQEPDMSRSDRVTGWAIGLFPPFGRQHGLVRSKVLPAELRKLPNVVGVDGVAVQGQDFTDSDLRMANLTLYAAQAAELDNAAAAAEMTLRQRFAADLAEEPTEGGGHHVQS